MTEAKFSIGDPVWSKMKGYCPWPSRIAAPSESTLRNTAADKLKTPKVHYLVYFFGSNNFAWMPEDTIKPYEEFKDKNKNGSKNAQFKQGLKQIEDYIANGGKATLEDTTPASGAAIRNNTNNDYATSPSAAGDSLSNDASNIDGDLPSIDEEIAAIHNRKPASSSTSFKKLKNSHDSHNDSSSLTSPAPSSVQKDYSRTPFKSRKTAKSEQETATEITSPTKRVKTSDDDSYGTSSLSSPTISTAITTSKPPTSKSGARHFLLRATQDVPTIETPQINMSSIPAKSKTIRASTLKFGFIGLGFMGQRLLKNLLNSGHQVTIWNRTSNKCREFQEAGATTAKTPADVVTAADIVFSCLTDPRASKEVVFGSFGILAEMDTNKGFVEMSSIDPETSCDISEAIISRGGRYLEAPPIGNGKKAAEDGECTIVAAGDRTLYEDCSSCFQAMGKQTFFVGHTVGMATKMNLIFSMLYGAVVGAVAECCALLERTEGSVRQFKDIVKLSIMNCPLTDSTIDKIIKSDNTVLMPLGHLQKDLRLSLNLAEEHDHSCPITAITNEVFKNSKKSGYTEYDATAVYLRSRF